MNVGQLVFSHRVKTGLQKFEEWEAEKDADYALMYLAMTKPKVKDAQIDQVTFGSLLLNAGCVQLVDVAECFGEDAAKELIEALQEKYIEPYLSEAPKDEQ